jgi:hypothetical protein
MGFETYRGRVTVLSMVLVMVAAFALPTVVPMETAEGAPNPIPILSLSLYPSSRTAFVTYNEGDTVSFDGNVTVDQMPYITSEVTLTAVVNTGWSVILSQSSFTFKNPGTQRFTVSVIVPAGVDGNVTGNLIVNGEAKVPLLAPVRAAASAVVQVNNNSPEPVWDVRILEPADGSTYTTDDVTISGTASYSAAPVTAVEVKVCTGPWTLATGTSEWTVDYDSGFLDDTVHTVRVRARAGEETSPITYMNITQDRSGGIVVPPTPPTTPEEQGLKDYMLPLGILMVIIGGAGAAYIYYRKRNRADIDYLSALTS